MPSSLRLMPVSSQNRVMFSQSENENGLSTESGACQKPSKETKRPHLSTPRTGSR